jgi:hypothetical protein
MVALFIHAIAHGFLHPFAGNQKKWKSAENGYPLDSPKQIQFG